MKRRLLNLLTLLALPLFIAAGAFWVRSHWIGDYLRGYDQPRLIECMSSDGLLMISCGHVVSRDYLPPPGWEGSFWPFHRKAGRFDADLHRHATLGFGYQRWRRGHAHGHGRRAS